MDFETFFAKTPATLDEIRTRVAYALKRHPLCRSVQFDIVSMPRTSKGNWTISLRSITPDALWKHPILSRTSRKPTIWPLPPDFWAACRWCCAVGPARCRGGGTVKP